MLWEIVITFVPLPIQTMSEWSESLHEMFWMNTWTVVLDFKIESVISWRLAWSLRFSRVLKIYFNVKVWIQLLIMDREATGWAWLLFKLVYLLFGHVIGLNTVVYKSSKALDGPGNLICKTADEAEFRSLKGRHLKIVLIVQYRYQLAPTIVYQLWLGSTCLVPFGL